MAWTQQPILPKIRHPGPLPLKSPKNLFRKRMHSKNKMIEFPLMQPVFEYQFGVRAMPNGLIPFRQTADFNNELLDKRKIFESRRGEVFAMAEDSALACRETAEWMTQIVPWLEDSQSDEQPLVGAGLQVQEDIAVLKDDAESGFPIIGGLVCFPSGWSIRDKLGYSIGHTHEDVPGFTEQMLKRTAKLFESLRPLKTVFRHNWMIAPTPALSMLPSDSARNVELRRSLTSLTMGEQGYFRVEFQTLTRMRKTMAIVFTILTTRCKLNDLTDYQVKILRGVIKTIPDSVSHYKRITPMRQALQEYLDERGGGLSTIAE